MITADDKGVSWKDCVKLLGFIEIIFKVLAISMRYEPSNAKYFNHEVTFSSLLNS